MTDWPCHVWLQKIVWPTNKVVFGVGGGGCCYLLLCTILSDGTSCSLPPNHNIHKGKWCLFAMKNMSFEVKKSRKCIFQGFGEPSSKILAKQTVKKLNLWEKTAVDKSAWIKACISCISEFSFPKCY